MNLIISAQNPTIESPVDTRFGRSQWLILVDADTKQWKAFQNPGVSQSGGAGVAAAQFVVDQKADVVISGDFGPNASRAFQSANIEMRLFPKQALTVEEATELYKSGALLNYK